MWGLERLVLLSGNVITLVTLLYFRDGLELLVATILFWAGGFSFSFLYVVTFGIYEVGTNRATLRAPAFFELTDCLWRWGQSKSR